MKLHIIKSQKNLLHNWAEFQPLNTKPRSVIIVLHGLNQIPKDMDELCMKVSEHGHYVIRGYLSGHAGIGEEEQIVRYQQWEQDTQDLLEYGHKKALEFDVNLYSLGFSTGNLCFLNTLVNYDHPPIKKMIMIAPPVEMTKIGKLSRGITFLPDRTYIPSPDPNNVSRACVRLNASYYKAFFKVKDHFHHSIGQHHNIPALMMGHIYDEIVQTKKFDHFIETNKFDNWQSISFDDEKYRPDSYYHIIVSAHYWGSMAHKLAIKACSWLEN